MTSSAEKNCSWIAVDMDRLRVSGRDRVSWLHNFCTADIKGLQVGSLCEAFVLNGKGKLVNWVMVAAHEDFLELLAPKTTSTELAAHLDRYLIREDVSLCDVSGEWEDLFVFGAGAPAWLHQHTGNSLPRTRFDRRVVNGEQLQLSSIDYLGPGYLLSYAVSGFRPSDAWLSGLGCPVATGADWQRHRILNGCPSWGIDVGEDNLPQELGRDELTISFTKGCYLGQETVARIDALGHVNRLLSVLTLSELPKGPLPWPLQDDGKKVGEITSYAEPANGHSPSVALGTLKRNAAKPETALQCESVTAMVVASASTVVSSLVQAEE